MQQNAYKSGDSASSGEGILLVANYESNVGFAWWLMENFWVELSVFFRRRGGQAVLVYPAINDIPQTIRDSSITVLAHDFGDRSRKNVRVLKKIVKDYNIAHVYLTDRGGYDIRYGLLRSWGVKTIVNHDHSFRAAKPSSALKRALTFALHKIPLISCDHYIAVSRFIQERLVCDAGIPTDKVSYVLNGIEPIEYDPKQQYYAQDVFGIPRDAMIVVSTGRAAYSKGIDTLIECARRLIAAGNSNLYFLHCGVGPDLESFKGMIRDYGLERRFLFAGKRTDVRQILPSCHIGIQISRGEAFSLALLEYLGAGLATLASAVGGNPEAIIDGKTGVLFPPGDVDFVVKTIQALLRDDQYRRRLGAAARASVQTHFNIRRTNQEVIALYERIIAQSV